ncbi:hypothetical protein LY76DRAFT_529210 [Colletotrichum caudatum]|nr:hypothetical protein LY76DRAFT_529210 [Colletotrichum caudatum]
MHTGIVLFKHLALLASLVSAMPEVFTFTGSLCCNAGVNDDSNFCKSQNLNSFCCSGFAADEGNGCDFHPEFPTGRNVIAKTPGENACTVPAADGSGDLNGFKGCA